MTSTNYPKNRTSDFEVVIAVFKCENGERKNSMVQTSLFFPNTKELLDWSDNSGVDFKSHLFPRVEAWSPRFWELFWEMEMNKMELARYFMRENWK